MNDIKSSSVYNKLVDIKSIMPVYAIPLLEEKSEKCLGVLEVSLKTQYKSKYEKDQLIDPEENLLGLSEPLSNLINNFTKLVGLALQFVKFKNE